jgi:predicted GIY-YIG superfamily endonuclease
MSDPTSVYRYYDAAGRHIYVGVTSRGPQRQAQHAVTAGWWPHVRSQDVEHLDTREAALRREKWLIERHRPPFNIQHHPDPENAKAAYLELVNPPKRCGHCEGCRLDTDPEYARPAGDEWGCRWNDEIAPDEDEITCPVCGSTRCIYADGHDDGSVDGWQAGYSSGQDRAWREAHDEYTPAYLADMTIRIVTDGAPNVPRTGHISLCVPGVEPSLTEMDAAIAEHGLSALVDKAAEGTKWARRPEGMPF